MALLLSAFIGGLVLPPSVRADEYRGTMEQQMACTPDVWRLCGDQIPDVNRIVACLRQNTPQLSEGCRAVFETNNRDDQPRSRRRRPPPAAGEPAQPPQSDDWLR
jgi:hypothetical protein